MKKIVLFFAGVAFALANDCDDKIAKLQNELIYAKKHDNTFKIQGLEGAINELSTKCKDDALYYQKILEQKAQKEREFEAIEVELKSLDSNKKSMAKADFQTKKAQLKAQKDKVKAELKAMELY